MFITASIAVSKQAVSFVGQPAAFGTADLPSLKSVADTIKSQGALAIAQLQHGGAVVLPELNGGKVLAPSSFKNKTLDTAAGKKSVTAEAMTAEHIRQTVADFANAADLALQAGFDGVEIHGANGYLINQYIDSQANNRQDNYGGSLQNRLRFLSETAQAVINQIGKDRVGVCLSPLTSLLGCIDDTPQATYLAVAKILDELGVQYLDIAEADWEDAPEMPAAFKEALRLIYSGTLSTRANTTANEPKPPCTTAGQI